MANWFQKLLSPPASKPKGRSLTTEVRQALPPVPFGGNSGPGRLPNASIIYGIAAGGLFAVALCFLFTGRWFTFILVLLPALCFLGYALYFMKHAS